MQHHLGPNEHDYEEYEYDDSDYGIPEIDPEIRTKYEAALGRLILAHNNVDVLLTQLLACCLRKLGDPPELKKLTSGDFARRLDNLTMLKAIPIDLRLTAINVAEIAELNGLRNKVAHGHFEQNMYDGGSYQLVNNGKRYRDFTTERLDAITARLTKQGKHLEPVVMFYSVAHPLPPGAIPLS